MLLMQCPFGDGELVDASLTTEQGVTLRYSRCSVCHSLWMDSIAGNYLPASVDQSSQPQDARQAPQSCPVCEERLEPAADESIPRGITAFSCPNSHGYLFPVGEYARFRDAQQVKLRYHRLWNIPLPSLHSVLLGSMMLFLLIGIGVTVIEIQKTRDVRSSAQHVIRSHSETVIPETGSVVVTVLTSTPAIAMLRIDQLDMSRPMETEDRLFHRVTIEGLPAGRYEAMLLVTVGADITRSDPITIVIPEPPTYP